MGRAVRKVPAGWKHPPHKDARYPDSLQPLYDEDFESAMKEWLGELEKWMAGEFQEVLARSPEFYSASEPYRGFADHRGTSPDPAYYRPAWKDEERTHFQLYETVSEGTPVSPVFATEDELIDYLVNNGDYWGQNSERDGRGNQRYSRQAAENVVRTGFAMSMVVVTSPGSCKVYEPKDAIPQ